MGKIMIDGLLRKEKALGRFYHPFVETDPLIQALESYQGPHALSLERRKDHETLRSKVKGYARTFLVSFKALQKFDSRVWMNRKFRRPLMAIYGGTGRDLPLVARSAEAAAEAVFAMVTGQQPPAPRRGMDGEEPGASCLGAQGCFLGTLGIQGELPAQTALLPKPSYRPLSEADQKVLGGLKKKIMKRFFAGLLVPNRRWEKLRNRVRQLVPTEAAVSPRTQTAPPPPVALPSMGGLLEATGN
jgi:hypothetical protein